MTHAPNTPLDLPRRDLLGATVSAVAGLGAVGCQAPGASASPEKDGSVRPGDRVLFQGDSITDAGRSRPDAAQPNRQSALGSGYAWLAAADLLVEHEGENLEVFNRGISGHKVHQLAARWDADCLDLRPDVLSILIGVNDIWHGKSGNYDGTVETYEEDLDALLVRTRTALPEVRLVICEPFVLRCGAIDDSWFPEFDHYRAAARRLSDRHADAWIPFQAMFDTAIQFAPPEHWAADGVHPTSAGASLMAQTWRRHA